MSTPATPAIDYDKIAAQQGAQPAAADYDALAGQHGGEAQSAPQGGPERPGIISRIWSWANKPAADNLLPEGMSTKDIVRGVAFEHLFGEPYIPGVNDFDTKGQAQLGDSPTRAAVKNFVAGSAKDASDMATSFTSPLSIALLGAGAAGKIPGAVGTVARAVTGVSSAALATKGVEGALEPQKPFESDADYVQRVLESSAMAAGGAAGAGASGAPRAIADRVLGYSPRDIEGVETTGQRSLGNLAQGPINRSMGATARDVRFGDPARALIENGITSPTNAGRLLGVNQKLAEVGPQVDSALAASKATVPVDELIDQQIAKAQAEIEKAKMTPAEKRGALRQLEALRETNPKGDYSPLEANEIKQTIGDAVNWEKRPSPMPKPVESAYRRAYGAIKQAINDAAPDVKELNENRTNLLAAKSALQEGLLRAKVGQGPEAGLGAVQKLEAVSGHAMSPLLAKFGRIPPEANPMAAINPKFTPSLRAMVGTQALLNVNTNQ